MTARPLCLVHRSEDEKYNISQESISFLEDIKVPIAIISVTGSPRKGKSALLNQFLGKSDGFKVASGDQSCTKGLWIWGTPIYQKDKNGADFAILLMDTEGIDVYSPEKGLRDIRTFSLAFVLSSVLIHNQMGGSIGKAGLHELSLITDITKHVHSDSGEASKIPELGIFSPSFIWLLRDQFDDNMEPNEQLENLIKSVDGAVDSSHSTEIVKAIRDLFHERACASLVRPHNNEDVLMKLQETPVDQLRDKFKSGRAALVESIKKKISPKIVNEVVLTGPVLIRITRLLLDGFNKNKATSIGSVWQDAESSLCQEASDKATNAYVDSFQPVADHTRVARKMSLDYFHYDAVLDGPAKKKAEKTYQASLVKAVETHLIQGHQVAVVTAVAEFERLVGVTGSRGKTYKSRFLGELKALAFLANLCLLFDFEFHSILLTIHMFQEYSASMSTKAGDNALDVFHSHLGTR